MRRCISRIALLAAAFLLFGCMAADSLFAHTSLPTGAPVTAQDTPIVTGVATVDVTRSVSLDDFAVPPTFTPASPPAWTVDISAGPMLTRRRTHHTATVLKDGTIMLIGGSNGVNIQYAVAEVFDPEMNTFRQLAPLNTARHDHSATLLEDQRVLVVGGYNAQRGWLDDAELYDPYANAWTAIPPNYSHGVQHTSTRLQDGRVLVVGGCIGSSECTDRVEIFDPSSETWNDATPLPSRRAAQIAVLLDDGRVLIAGGGPSAAEAMLYDPRANTWEATGRIPSLPILASAVKLLGGRILMAGGLDHAQEPRVVNDTEIYDPSTNAWRVVAGMPHPRYAFTLALLPDGEVMATGGADRYESSWTRSSFDQEIDVYNIDLDLWYAAGTLPQPEAFGAAVPLPDGSYWLTGGGTGHALSAALRYTWKITPRMSGP